jgi:hypothetical protein
MEDWIGCDTRLCLSSPNARCTSQNYRKAVQSSPRGHWTGAMESGGVPETLEVDLDQTSSGWIGSMSVVAQKSVMPLDSISFADGRLTFHRAAGASAPSFTGTISEDGKALSGSSRQGQGSAPAKFSRTREPKVEVIKDSPPVPQKFLGTWEGAIDIGPTLRMIVKISNEAGACKAVLIIPGPGGVEVPVSSVEQKDSNLKLVVRAIGGDFDGEINPEGSELDGRWTQMDLGLPLTLKKVEAAK